MPDAHEPAQSHFVAEGDLLFSRANTTELVGAVAYVHDAPSNLLLPDKIWRFVWREPRAVDPLFVWALFQTRNLRHEIGRRATGTSGSMKNISQEKVMGIQTILPPLAIQQSFAQRLRKIGQLNEKCRRALEAHERFFASLQHQAFNGQL